MCRVWNRMVPNIHRVLTNIIKITKTVAELQKPQLINKSLTVEFEIAEDIPEVFVSPDLFREAVSNLLSNAVKYGDPNRTINISLSLQDQNIIFSITDHGYGIPPEAQQKLFTKFFRVNNPKASKELGTGLGLAYVKEIAACSTTVQSRLNRTRILDASSQLHSRCDARTSNQKKQWRAGIAC